MSADSKKKYSLFGDPERGYQRFLYDGYLASDHPSQGVRLELTSDKLRRLNERSETLVMLIEDALKKTVNDRIWPVERRLLLFTAYCLLNALERAKVLLGSLAPDQFVYFANRNSLQLYPAGTTAQYLAKIIPDIYEYTLVSILKSRGVEIRYVPDSAGTPAEVKRGENGNSFYSRRRLYALWSKYKFKKELFFFRMETRCRNKKALLFVLNGQLDSDDINICKEDSHVLYLNNWHVNAEPYMTGKMNDYLTTYQNIERENLKDAFRKVNLDD